MISDKTIIIASLLLTIAGISALFVLTLTTQTRIVSIDKINNSYIGSSIITKGRTIRLTIKNNNTFITLKSLNTSKTIDISAFGTKYNFTKGSILKIRGRVHKYNNKLNIIAESIQQI